MSDSTKFVIYRSPLYLIFILVGIAFFVTIGSLLVASFFIEERRFLHLMLIEGGLRLFFIFLFCSIWFWERYIITPQKIIVKKGLFTTHLNYIDIESVIGISVQQGIMGKLFHFGTVVLELGDAERVALKSVDSPYSLTNIIQSYKNTSASV